MDMTSLPAFLQNALAQDQYWVWWAAAMIMLVFEILLPSAWLIWPAVAAFVVGAMAYFLPTVTGSEQIAIFVLLAFAATYFGRRYFKVYLPKETDSPNLNNRLADLVGRKGQALDDSNDEYNRIRLDDTIWRIKAANHRSLPKGATLEVYAEEHGTLLVKVIEV